MEQEAALLYGFQPTEHARKLDTKGNACYGMNCSLSDPDYSCHSDKHVHPLLRYDKTSVHLQHCNVLLVILDLGIFALLLSTNLYFPPTTLLPSVYISFKSHLELSFFSGKEPVQFPGAVSQLPSWQ